LTSRQRRLLPPGSWGGLDAAGATEAHDLAAVTEGAAEAAEAAEASLADLAAKAAPYTDLAELAAKPTS
jgi:hypothetical protein